MIVRARVVFPHPDSPTSASTSPSLTVRSTPSTARATVPSRPSKLHLEALHLEQRCRRRSPTGSRWMQAAVRLGAGRQHHGLPVGALGRHARAAGWNGQPDGSSRGSGGSPPSPRRRHPVARVADDRERGGERARVRDAPRRRRPRRPALPRRSVPRTSPRALRQTLARTERSWVMKSIARPRSRWRSSSRRSTCACTITSSAVVGSSAISS